MSGHSGTHLDALSHVAHDGLVYEGQPLSIVQGGVEGLTHGSIESVAPIFRRGLLLDVPRHRKSDVLPAGTAVNAAEMEQIVVAAGLAVGDGDCVLIRTGFGSYWDTDSDRYLGIETGVPGVDLDGAVWLQERGVFLVGSDTAVFECMPSGATEMPVHLHLLARHGVFIMENMDLETLSRRGCLEFLFVALPLALAGSSGSPVRAVALLSR